MRGALGTTAAGPVSVFRMPPSKWSSSNRFPSQDHSAAHCSNPKKEVDLPSLRHILSLGGDERQGTWINFYNRSHGMEER